MIKDKSEVDIILPNYNSERFIDQTLKSVINQSFKNWKLIIVDDASNPKTKSQLLKYIKHPKIKIFFLSRNRGAGFCRNFAIKNSFSKYIAFIDSDDLWHKQKLKFQIDFMKKKKSDFSYTFYKTFGLKKRKIKTPLTFSFPNFINNTSIATSTMIVSRKIVKNIKFTNSKICRLFFKCSLLKKIGYAQGVNRYLAYYRITSGSLQSNKFKNLYWIWKINSVYNKLNLIDNIRSLVSISFNSLKKYGFK